MSERKAYPTDVSDEEWAFVAPYLTLMTEDAPQRDHPLRSASVRPSVRTRSLCTVPRDAWCFFDTPIIYIDRRTHRFAKIGRTLRRALACLK